MNEASEAKEFIALIQKLDEQKQAGILLMIRGMRLLADKKKKAAVNYRFHS